LLPLAKNVENIDRDRWKKWPCLAANENQSAIYLAALAISDLVFLLFDGAALVNRSAGVRVSVHFDFGTQRCGYCPHFGRAAA